MEDLEAWLNWGSNSDRVALLQDLEFANVIGERVHRLEILLAEAEELRILMTRMLEILERKSV